MGILYVTMAAMGKDTKAIIAVAVATFAIIFGGVFLVSNKQNKALPTANPTVLISEASYKDIAPNEKVVLVEFGDLQCPACGAYHPLVKQAREEFKDSLTYVFRNFPLTNIHKNAKAAAYVLEAAGMQNKYWEMQDTLYENQNKWSSLDDPKETFLGYAKLLGLDTAKLLVDMDSPAVKKKVDQDVADGTILGVDSTPTFYLNGVKTKLFSNYEDFKKGIETAAKNAQVVEEGDDHDEDGYHAHFDLKIYQNSLAIDLSQDKYQSKEGEELNEDIHLHDGNGKVVHMHKEGVTLGELFTSIKLSVKGKLYVNGKLVEGDLNNYSPKDLDRILITDGNESGISLVSDDACIYSEKCPERGTPPPEACVGGLGTGCE